MLLIVLRLCQLSEVRRRRNGIRDSANTCQRYALMQRLLCTPGQNKFCTPEIFLAALIYGMTWMIKPLTILTVPFILPQFGIAGLLSLAMWGGYVSWSLQWEFGRHQIGFLLQQVMISSMKTSKSGKMPHVSLSLSAALYKLLGKIQGSLGWRWTHLGRKAVKALPFYLFPVWLRPWAWRGIALAVVIIIGYGNIKYLLLDLLFIFPVSNEEESIIAA
jgi:hypothetical protein